MLQRLNQVQSFSSDEGSGFRKVLKRNRSCRRANQQAFRGKQGSKGSETEKTETTVHLFFATVQAALAFLLHDLKLSRHAKNIKKTSVRLLFLTFVLQISLTSAMNMQVNVPFRKQKMCFKTFSCGLLMF